MPIYLFIFLLTKDRTSISLDSDDKGYSIHFSLSLWLYIRNLISCYI